MFTRHRLEILALVLVAVLAILALVAVRAGFPGSDTVASGRIQGLTGNPGEKFHPLVWQWVPPGAGAESALFALQAAIGGIIVGWAFWHWRGQKGSAREMKKEQEKG